MFIPTLHPHLHSPFTTTHSFHILTLTPHPTPSFVAPLGQFCVHVHSQDASRPRKRLRVPAPARVDRPHLRVTGTYPEHHTYTHYTMTLTINTNTNTHTHTHVLTRTCTHHLQVQAARQKGRECFQCFSPLHLRSEPSALPLFLLPPSLTRIPPPYTPLPHTVPSPHPQGSVDIDALTDPCERASVETQIREFGQTPTQVGTQGVCE